MLAKLSLYLAVVLVAAWMIAAGILVSTVNISDKMVQLTLGSIGEPDDLNPIISSTVSASEVQSFVFNGLLKYDENVKVVGSLADSYALSQDSVAFFSTAEEADLTLRQLEAAEDRWGEMNLQSIRQEGRRLILHFEDSGKVAAGTGYEKVLFSIINRQLLLPVSAMTISFDPEAKNIAGKPIDATGIVQRLQELATRLQNVSVIEATPIGNSLLGLVVVGQTKAFKDGLLAFSSDIKAEILDSLDQVLLNEPIITFRIRPGVHWQDGPPLTAHDAVFTYKCIVDPQYRSPRASDYWPVKSARAKDDLTFEVRYRYPFSECVNSWMMPLLPRHLLEGRDAQWWADHYNSRPVGTGPFSVSQWKRNEFIHLDANQNYFEGVPNLPRVVYRILPDPFVNQVAFDAREFDINDRLFPYQVSRYEHDKNFDVYHLQGLEYTYIGWNLQNPLFSDRKVRLALAHAIDVGRIIKYVYRGYGKASAGIFPSQMWFANKDIKPLEHDLQAARQLLREAGWTDSDGDGVLDKNGLKFEFTLITNNGNTIRAAIQALVQDDLRHVGIKVNVATYEWAVFIKNYVDSRQFDACVLGWTLGYSYDQFQLWHSSQAAAPGLNFISYRNPEADDLLLKIRTTFDRQEIARLCGRLQATIYGDQPYLFLCNPEIITALYRDKYVVRRPDGKGGWIFEAVRNTELGVGYYENWWAPALSSPALTP